MPSSLAATRRRVASEAPFHRSSDFCGTCHDVSNPVTGDLAPGHGSLTPLAPGKFSGVLGSPIAGKAAFNNPPYAYGTVERTYSEHKASAFPTLRVSNYGTLPAELRAGSIEQAYDAAMTSTPTGDYEDGDPRFFTCQTCHMPPVVGTGDGIGLGPVRRDVPKHTLVGGNYWTPRAIQYLEAQNRLLLGNGLTAEQHAAIDDGVAASKAYLEAAASLKVTGNTLRVVNLTGHKLFTGYPEGSVAGVSAGCPELRAVCFEGEVRLAQLVLSGLVLEPLEEGLVAPVGVEGHSRLH